MARGDDLTARRKARFKKKKARRKKTNIDPATGFRTNLTPFSGSTDPFKKPAPVKKKKKR